MYISSRMLAIRTSLFKGLRGLRIWGFGSYALALQTEKDEGQAHHVALPLLKNFRVLGV